MLSLLARQLGIGTVIYNDLYDVSCHDAQRIGESTGNRAHHYIHGDIDDVLGFLRTSGLNCNAVASIHVIEHVYDIKSLFRKVTYTSRDSLVVVMSSGANMFNRRTARRLMKLHYEHEHHDRDKKRGHKERDTLRAFLSVRRDIISRCSEGLTADEIESLAIKTRGMIDGDIRKCVRRYTEKKEFPRELGHPTNTCDPYTGNWAEHLMDPHILRDILSREGFRAEVMPGYYSGRYGSGVKQFLTKCANLGIRMSKWAGMRIGPFFTVYGKRELS